MADKLLITVHLQKEVETVEQGKALFELVKQKLADQPTVKISGGVSTQFDLGA